MFVLDEGGIGLYQIETRWFCNPEEVTEGGKAYYKL